MNYDTSFWYFAHVGRFLNDHYEHTWADEMRAAFYEDVLKAIAKDATEPARLAEIALDVGGDVGGRIRLPMDHGETA